jgi:hypothetical protein
MSANGKHPRPGREVGLVFRMGRTGTTSYIIIVFTNTVEKTDQGASSASSVFPPVLTS